MSNGFLLFFRVDFNVPIENGQITNDYRIRSTIPTIRKIIGQGASAILMSHLGRPKGTMYEEGKPSGTAKGQEESSLRPVAERLEEIMKAEKADSLPVLFAEDCLDAQASVDQLQGGQILLLENVRFYKNEGSKVEDERLSMAKKIASYGDYYVSDAFGTAHRNSATMTGIPKVMGQGAAGYLMGKEIKAFSRVLNDAPRPMVAIVGGSKVSDKILLLENLILRVDKLVIGGAMAYTFLKAQGYEIGTSFSQAGQMFKDKDGGEIEIGALAKQLLEKAKEKGVEVSLPLDHVCHTTFGEPEDGKALTTEDANIPAGYMALDIGPKTVELYMAIIKECKTAIWNGPMGVFEMETYRNGTFSVAKVMGDETEKNGMLSIIGGGDSASAAELSGDASRMYHTSTGGGASLELLEGKALPGIDVLDDN
jgi:phosphoglycerate kinase